MNAAEILSGGTYRGKRHPRTPDRTVLGVGHQTVQYDSDAVADGRRYPSVTIEKPAVERLGPVDVARVPMRVRTRGVVDAPSARGDGEGGSVSVNDVEEQGRRAAEWLNERLPDNVRVRFGDAVPHRPHHTLEITIAHEIEVSDEALLNGIEGIASTLFHSIAAMSGRSS